MASDRLQTAKQLHGAITAAETQNAQSAAELPPDSKQSGLLQRFHTTKDPVRTLMTLDNLFKQRAIPELSGGSTAVDTIHQSWDQMRMTASPKLADDLDLALIEGGCNVRLGDSDEVHFLNATAAAILLLCDGQTSELGIAKSLQSHFRLSDPPIDDVAEVLAEFEQAGLVRLQETR